MSWQKCPVCNGTGVNTVPGTFSGVNPCPTCNGHRIISEISGLPPAYEIKTGVASTNVNPGGVCNSFTPSSATSSATMCKWCGKEKWLHPTYVSSPNSSVTVTSVDKCIMCGEDTIYHPNTHISLRMGYVEGAGQLCQSCYKS